jgi:hypothetical protein
MRCNWRLDSESADVIASKVAPTGIFVVHRTSVGAGLPAIAIQQAKKIFAPSITRRGTS